MGSFSLWHWLVVLLIVVMVFGTNKLKNMGKDVGEAVKNFKDVLNQPHSAAGKDPSSNNSSHSK